MRKILFISIIIFSFNSNAQSIETLWRARGLEAVENLEKLEKKKASGIKLTSKEKCRLFLEKGYSLFADSEMAKIAIQKNDKNTSIMLRLQTEGAPLSISFAYQGKSMAPSYIMPAFDKHTSMKDWMIMIMPGRPSGSFIVKDENCTYSFYLKDYLNPEIEN